MFDILFQSGRLSDDLIFSHTVLSRHYGVGYYNICTMPGKYLGLRALLWYFNSYYDSPGISIYFRYPIIKREHCVIVLCGEAPLSFRHLQRT
jgi:hypothetical protein